MSDLKKFMKEKGYGEVDLKCALLLFSAKYDLTPKGKPTQTSREFLDFMEDLVKAEPDINPLVDFVEENRENFIEEPVYESDGKKKKGWKVEGNVIHLVDPKKEGDELKEQQEKLAKRLEKLEEKQRESLMVSHERASWEVKVLLDMSKMAGKFQSLKKKPSKDWGQKEHAKRTYFKRTAALFLAYCKTVPYEDRKQESKRFRRLRGHIAKWDHLFMIDYDMPSGRTDLSLFSLASGYERDMKKSGNPDLFFDIQDIRNEANYHNECYQGKKMPGGIKSRLNELEDMYAALNADAEIKVKDKKAVVQEPEKVAVVKSSKVVSMVGRRPKSKEAEPPSL